MFAKRNTDPDLQIKNGMMTFLHVRKFIFIFDQVRTYKAYNFKSKSFINVIYWRAFNINDKTFGWFNLMKNPETSSLSCSSTFNPINWWKRGSFQDLYWAMGDPSPPILRLPAHKCWDWKEKSKSWQYELELIGIKVVFNCIDE